MKKIAKLKLNNLSASALEAREMNQLNGGDDYCACACDPGVNASDFLISSKTDPSSQCSCGCGCNPMMYVSLTALTAISEDIGGY